MSLSVRSLIKSTDLKLTIASWNMYTQLNKTRLPAYSIHWRQKCTLRTKPIWTIIKNAVEAGDWWGGVVRMDHVFCFALGVGRELGRKRKKALWQNTHLNTKEKETKKKKGPCLLCCSNGLFCPYLTHPTRTHTHTDTCLTQFTLLSRLSFVSSKRTRALEAIAPRRRVFKWCLVQAQYHDPVLSRWRHLPNIKYGLNHEWMERLRPTTQRM